jgi:WD40 repeat protein
MVGISHQHHGGANIFICDVASGVYMHSHPLNSDIPLSKGTWTHGESLQFATVDTTTITIWEVEFISAGTPKKVETLPAPDNFDPTMSPHVNSPSHTEVQFLPTPYLLVLISLGKVLLWDIRNSRCLLDCTDIGLYPVISFSSDGCFFTCSTIDGIGLWKKSPTGYILHTTLQLGALRYSPNPLLSHNGEFLAVSYDCTIRLWHTNSFTTSPSSVLAQAPTSPEDFILDFSPDGTLAVIAMNNDNTVTILNLKSGIPQLTISTDIWVRGLRVIGSTVVVIGYQGVGRSLLGTCLQRVVSLMLGWDLKIALGQ